MNTLVIRKRKWARGGKNGESALLNDQGAMCCLGFLGRECGNSRLELLNGKSPATTNGLLWPRKLLNRYGNNTPLCSQMIRVNDDEDIGDDVRFAALRPLFRKIGFRLVLK